MPADLVDDLVSAVLRLQRRPGLEHALRPRIDAVLRALQRFEHTGPGGIVVDELERRLQMGHIAHERALLLGPRAVVPAAAHDLTQVAGAIGRDDRARRLLPVALGRGERETQRGLTPPEGAGLDGQGTEDVVDTAVAEAAGDGAVHVQILVRHVEGLAVASNLLAHVA